MNLTTCQRISTKGEPFLITNIVTYSDVTLILQTEGLSELENGKRLEFGVKIKDDITPLNSINTFFIANEDDWCRKTKLVIERHIRNSIIFSDKITVADNTAYNISLYQLTPTIKKMHLQKQPLSIAEIEGLGKTIEIGIFLAEMLNRVKGKRIMLLALKSILGQFEQELWNRFSISLVRLDSEVIARIKTQLPSNKKPFDYYDKTNVSIRKLKNSTLTMEELLLIYNMKFPFLQLNKDDTCFETKRKIEFTCSKGLTEVDLYRAEWKNIKNYKIGETYDNTIEKSELYKEK